MSSIPTFWIIIVIFLFAILVFSIVYPAVKKQQKNGTKIDQDPRKSNKILIEEYHEELREERMQVRLEREDKKGEGHEVELEENEEEYKKVEVKEEEENKPQEEEENSEESSEGE